MGLGKFGRALMGGVIVCLATSVANGQSAFPRARSVLQPVPPQDDPAELAESSQTDVLGTNARSLVIAAPAVPQESPSDQPGPAVETADSADAASAISAVPLAAGPAEDAVPITAAGANSTPVNSVAANPAATCSVCASAGPSGQKTCCHGELVDWSKYPATITPMPRPGMFPNPPSGPGYHSFADCLFGRRRNNSPESGYVSFAINAWPFFDADWRFVDSIPPEQRTFVERLKRIPVGDCWMLGLGGEFWSRYTNETNSRLTNFNNDFGLTHFRQYADLAYGDSVRIYGEYVWADVHGEDLPRLPADSDRGDLLNLFVDLKLGELGGQSLFVRGGRQELLYGSQRLLTPLPWANRRNTFDGIKLFSRGAEWNVDAFWTQFVPVQSGEFDTPNSDQTLAGAWLTRKPRKGEFRDLYYLYYDNDAPSVTRTVPRAPVETHTVGGRLAGNQDDFLWDVEGAMQFGDLSGNELLAGMGTIGMGRRLSGLPMSPTVWLYYDYASGDDNLASGDAHTFNPIFPFGHYYLGWMDLVGRQNIHDLNAHLYFYPAAWTTVWLQYHRFWLAESQDALYSAGGVPLRYDPTGAAGQDVGDEIDVVLNFHLSRYSDILVSYNRLFGGDFLEATPGPADAEALYFIYQQRW